MRNTITASVFSVSLTPGRTDTVGICGNFMKMSHWLFCVEETRGLQTTVDVSDTDLLLLCSPSHNSSEHRALLTKCG